MTVKPETNFWKSVKKLLESGVDRFLFSRVESYVTPGFPDCLVFHKKTGFFTIELKIIQPNGKVRISPLQTAWNKWYGGNGAQTFIMVDMLNKQEGEEGRHVKVFPGLLAQELRDKGPHSVPGVYEGGLTALGQVRIWQKIIANSQTP